MGGSRLRRVQERNCGSCQQWVNGLGLWEPHARTIGACSLYSAAQVMNGMPGLGGWIWLGGGSDGGFGDAQDWIQGVGESSVQMPFRLMDDPFSLVILGSLRFGSPRLGHGMESRLGSLW